MKKAIAEDSVIFCNFQRYRNTAMMHLCCTDLKVKRITGNKKCKTACCALKCKAVQQAAVALEKDPLASV